MRNLKRALSLGLTAAMISGLMVMGSSAASYADVTSEDNQEAIEVLQAVGIMVGDENGDFNPDQNVTRNEMAVIMANLMEYNVATYRGTSPFTDVPSWAEPYVAACYTNGLTAGYSATTYGGSDSVTTAQAALMLMKALGYFQYASDFGSDWQLATTRQGNDIDLFNGVNTGVEQALTRNDVAQLVLNTLKSGTVQAETNGSLTIGGVTISRDVTYSYVTSNATYARAISNNKSTNTSTDATQSIVELGEKLYQGDLKLEDGTIDDFGRPSRTWSYDGEEVGTYAKQELLKQTYTVKVEGGDIYSDIGATACDYDLSYWVDGVEYNTSQTKAVADQLTRRNTEQVGTTAKGVLTEVYVDDDENETTIVEIHTYLAKAITDYNERNERLTVEVYTGRDNAGNVLSVSKRLEVEDLPSITKYVEDDFMMVTMADGVVKTVADPTVVTDAYVSSYSSRPVDGIPNPDGRLTSVTADGTKYDISAEAYYDPEYLYDYSDDSQQLDGYTYNLLLDSYGYLLGIENVTDDENFFFVVGYEVGSSVLAKTVDKALVIFPDGTMRTVDAMEKDGTPDVTSASESNINAWYNYTINSDGVYVISGLTNRQFAETRTSADPDEGKINSSNTTMGTDIDVKPTDGSAPAWVYGNNDSVYISVDKDTTVSHLYGSIVDVNGISTGIKNTSIIPEGVVGQFGQADKANVFGLYNSNGYVTYAIVVGDNGSISENFVYLTSGITGSRYDTATKQYIYQYDAITNTSDEVITVEFTTRTDTGNAQLRADTLYVASYDADGFIDKMELKTDDNTGSGAQYNTETYKDEGYGQMTISTIGQKQKVVLSGAVLYLNASDNNQYVVLDEDCRFFVNGKDDTNGDYDLYPTAASALAALGEGNEVTGLGKIVIITDSTTGFGTTVIFLDAEYEETGSPVNPVTGRVSLSNVKIGGVNVGNAAGYSDIDDAVKHAQPISLSSAQLNGTFEATATSNQGTALTIAYKVFADSENYSDFNYANADGDNTVTTTPSAAVTGTPSLGNNNVIVIRANDNSGSPEGNVTYFAYVINQIQD